MPTSVWTDTASGPLRELGYSGAVELTGGPLADRLANAAETYGGLSMDSILKGFRQRAGLASPGAGLGGWLSRDHGGNVRAVGQRAGPALEGTGRSGPRGAGRGPGGGLCGDAPRRRPDGHGHLRVGELVCGLVDTAVYGGYTPALDLLSKIVRAESFDRTRLVPTANDFAGASPAFTPEWYTLPENLYRGYLAGGDAALAEFARLWHYDAYWDCFADQSGKPKSWDIPVWLHAYSHVNTLSSAAAVSDVYHEPRYLSVLKNAHDWMVETQCYATGGYGPCELTVPSDGTLGRALEWRNDTAEIVCGTWAAFKLCTSLAKATGDARYFEWPERLLYNGLGATIPVRPDGFSPYYSDYRLGWATKAPYWEQWPCCSGTYVQAVAHIPDSVYQATEDGISVSLFVPSRVTTAIGKHTVVLEQRTAFPESNETVLSLRSDQPVELTLRVRVPSWSRRTVLELNGIAVDHSAGPSNGWPCVGPGSPQTP